MSTEIKVPRPEKLAGSRAVSRGNVSRIQLQMRRLQLKLQLAALLEQMRKDPTSKIWRLPVKPELEDAWLIRAFRRAGYEAYFSRQDDSLRIRIIASLAVEDYDRLARRRGISWIGLAVPPSTTHKTSWRCKQGHKWRANYRNIEVGYGWIKRGRIYSPVFCPHCAQGARRYVRR